MNGDPEMAHRIHASALPESTRRRIGPGLGAALVVGCGTLAVATHVRGTRHTPAAAPPASPVSPVTRGEKATASGGVDGWVAGAERAVSEHPRSADALRDLAVAFMRKQRQCGDPGYYRRAMAAIERSLVL